MAGFPGEGRLDGDGGEGFLGTIPYQYPGHTLILHKFTCPPRFVQIAPSLTPDHRQFIYFRKAEVKAGLRLVGQTTCVDQLYENPSIPSIQNSVAVGEAHTLAIEGSDGQLLRPAAGCDSAPLDAGRLDRVDPGELSGAVHRGRDQHHTGRPTGWRCGSPLPGGAGGGDRLQTFVYFVNFL